jgi:non-specific serine/threonine protein kinase
MLDSGKRTVHNRHRTLQAVMDWSYTLLNEIEQLLLQRLSVFAGGWTLDAAEAVCADETLGAEMVAQHLLRLVDKSLVSSEQTDSAPARYGMLETVRQYAHDRLQGAGTDSAEAVQERHTAWYLSLAERSEPALAGPEQVAMLSWLEADQDNLRAALRWSFASAARAEQAVRLVAALWRCWEIHVHWTEASQWLKRALDSRHLVTAPARIRILSAASTHALNLADLDQAGRFLDEALTLQRAVGDRYGIATSLHKLALLHQHHGEIDRAVGLYQECLALRRALGDAGGMASTLNNLGVIANGCQRYAEAAQFFGESQAL